jgi:hypothetical protein
LVDAACRGWCCCCCMQKERGRATATDALFAMVETEGPIRLRRWGSGSRAGGRGREEQSTHHRLRRYRRRVFLILPGPIWDMLLRHDCCYCAVVVEGSGAKGPGAVDEG